MKGKEVIPGGGIEIIKRDKRVSVAEGGITITRKGSALQRKDPAKAGYVYLVIDCSESMAWKGKMQQAKRGALGFFEKAISKGYSTGIIAFSTTPFHVCSPQSEPSSMNRYLEKIEAGGATNIADAIDLAIQYLQNKDGLKAMVIITDGAPNIGEPDGETAALREALRAKGQHIDILTIGTDDARKDFLERLATRMDLASYVASEDLGKAITSFAQLLPGASKREIAES